MLKETTLTVQTCDLKVDTNCDGCAKDIKKIMRKIHGVYQTNVDRNQGKVTVTGLMDMDTVFKKLKKTGMSVQLWDANSAAACKHQKLQLDGSDGSDQLKDANGKGLPQGEASNNSGCGARSSGGMNDDATMVLPQLTLTPEQNVPNIQQQIEKRLQMLNGEKLHPHLGMPPVMNRGGKLSGKKVGGGTKVLVPRNANNDNKNDMGTKLYQDAGGSQVKNGAYNGALGSLPRNGFYPSSAGSSGTEMMQQVARNPMPQEPYMMVHPQQEHEMMMNGHCPQSQNAHYGPGCNGYQLMGYDNGHGHLQQHSPPMYYPMPPPPQHDNIVSEENPNICSLM